MFHFVLLFENKFYICSIINLNLNQNIMKLKVKFKVLYWSSGKKSTKIHTYNDCPDFEDIVFNSKIINSEMTISALDQADEWVLNIDKKGWMDSNDIQIIFDWEILSCIKDVVVKATETNLSVVNVTKKELVIKEKKLSNSEVVAMYVTDFLPCELKDDFIAVYGSMKESIKSLHYEKQIEIVDAGMKVAYKSANNVFDRLNEIKNQVELEYSEKKKKINKLS